MKQKSIRIILEAPLSSVREEYPNLSDKDILKEVKKDFEDVMVEANNEGASVKVEWVEI